MDIQFSWSQLSREESWSNQSEWNALAKCAEPSRRFGVQRNDRAFSKSGETCRYTQGFELERIGHVELNRIWKRNVQSCSSSAALPRQLRQASSKRQARFLLEPTPCGKARRKSEPFSIS